MAMSSRFSGVEFRPPLQLDILNRSFHQDEDANKVNLWTKSCRADDGSAWLLKWLRQVELNIAVDPQLSHEYYHPLGNQQFRDAASKFLLGDSAQCIRQGRAIGVQALGGHGALRLALEFLSKEMGFKRYYLSSPTSDDQYHVFSRHRRPIEIRKYSYWDPVTRNVNFQDMLEDLKEAQEDSVIVLHMCCHNPTGCDLTKEQWIQLADLMQERKLFPLFDASYQGMCSGDPDEDAWPVRYFVDRGFELLCAQSFSTNLGLYDCRVGNLTFIVNHKLVENSILQKSTWSFYNIYGTPAHHGAKIVLTVLEDPVLRLKWYASLKEMSKKLQALRGKLRKLLESLNSSENEGWSHITEQIGLFSYTGLSEKQVDYLRKCYHIYMEKTGNINISTLTADNIDYVGRAIHHTVQNCPNIINNNNAVSTNAYAG